MNKRKSSANAFFVCAKVYVHLYLKGFEQMKVIDQSGDRFQLEVSYVVIQ